MTYMQDISGLSAQANEFSNECQPTPTSTMPRSPVGGSGASDYGSDMIGVLSADPGGVVMVFLSERLTQGGQVSSVKCLPLEIQEGAFIALRLEVSLTPKAD
jgi:hypothetical protein